MCHFLRVWTKLFTGRTWLQSRCSWFWINMVERQALNRLCIPFRFKIQTLILVSFRVSLKVIILLSIIQLNTLGSFRWKLYRFNIVVGIPFCGRHSTHRLHVTFSLFFQILGFKLNYFLLRFVAHKAYMFLYALIQDF